MPVELRNAQRRFKLDVRRIKRAVQALLKAVGRSEAQVSVLFVDDQKIRQLHRQWMGEDTPTDVLSFPMDERVLGDVVISVETAARRAPENVTREIVRYLIHGLLHLIGHDHVRQADRRRMNQESRRLMKLSFRGEAEKSDAKRHLERSERSRDLSPLRGSR